MLARILNKLLEYSGIYLDVRYDLNLPMPGYSYMEIDINDRFIPTISLNPNLYPKDENVVAHILAHEWGHHVSGHIKVPTDIDKTLYNDKKDRDKKEDEADTYAAEFIKEYYYDKEPIIDFIQKISKGSEAKNRINILNSV